MGHHSVATNPIRGADRPATARALDREVALQFGVISPADYSLLVGVTARLFIQTSVTYEAPEALWVPPVGSAGNIDELRRVG